MKDPYLLALALAAALSGPSAHDAWPTAQVPPAPREELGTLAGEVRSVDGKPLPRVRVYAYSLPVQGLHDRPLLTSTDPRGRLSFHGLELGALFDVSVAFPVGDHGVKNAVAGGAPLTIIVPRLARLCVPIGGDEPVGVEQVLWRPCGASEYSLVDFQGGKRGSIDLELPEGCADLLLVPDRLELAPRQVRGLAVPSAAYGGTVPLVRFGPGEQVTVQLSGASPWPLGATLQLVDDGLYRTQRYDLYLRGLVASMEGRWSSSVQDGKASFRGLAAGVYRLVRLDSRTWFEPPTIVVTDDSPSFAVRWRAE